MIEGRVHLRELPLQAQQGFGEGPQAAGLDL